MASVRLVLNFVGAGALLAVLLVCWAGPGYISWDNSPGSGAAAMCVCSEQARQGATKLVSYQMIWAAVGAGFGAAVGIALAIRRRRRAAVPPPAA